MNNKKWLKFSNPDSDPIKYMFDFSNRLFGGATHIYKIKKNIRVNFHIMRREHFGKVIIGRSKIKDQKRLHSKKRVKNV